VRRKQLLKCECGCGREAYYNQMTEVVVEEAIDESLRQAKTKKRFLVTRGCKKPFEEELGMMTCLQLIVNRWSPKPKTLAQRLNVPRTFVQWWQRVGGALKIMRLQHAIYERTKGFEYARIRATQSAILFGCPRFLQGVLARRFLAAAKRKEAARDNAVAYDCT
jgi:hypothetical protein